MRPAVIAGDFNGWAFEFRPAYTNSRGECRLHAFATLKVVLSNRGHKATFTRKVSALKLT